MNRHSAQPGIAAPNDANAAQSTAGASQSTAAPWRGWFEPGRAAWWDSIFLGLLLLAMCSQYNLGDIGKDTTAQGYVTKQLKIALPDIALLLNFGWFILRTAVMRAWKRLWWPPLPCWALIFAIILAALHSPSIWDKVAGALEGQSGDARAMLKTVLADKGSAQAIKEAVAETIQFALYFLVAPWLFVNLLHDRRKTASQKTAGVDLTVPFALQSTAARPIVINRRVFALATFALAFALSGVWALRQSLGATPNATQALFGSPNAWAAFVAIALPLLLAFVQIDAAMDKFRRSALGIFALVLLTIFSPWATVAALIGCVAMALAARGPRRFRLALVTLLLVVFCGVVWQIQGRSDARRAEFLRVGSAKEKVKKQYLEWYVPSAMGLPGKRTLANGVGPGNYQINIGTYYVGLPSNPEEKVPPDSNNLYLVQALSLGAFGLGALLWTIFHFAALAARAHRLKPDDWLAAGVLGSLISWALVNVFHAAIVRGTGVVLAFLFALAVVAAIGVTTSDDEIAP